MRTPPALTNYNQKVKSDRREGKRSSHETVRAVCVRGHCWDSVCYQHPGGLGYLLVPNLQPPRGSGHLVPSEVHSQDKLASCAGLSPYHTV